MKVYLVKGMIFPVVRYECENWIKKRKRAEHQGIDAFKLWCWRRFLRAPWLARRSNWSILKELNPEYLLKGLMLKIKLQYLGHLRRANSLEKTLMLEKIEGKRRRGWQEMRWLDSITTQWTWTCTISRRQWWTGKPGMLQSMGSQRVGYNLATKQQQNCLRYTQHRQIGSRIALFITLLYSLSTKMAISFGIQIYLRTIRLSFFIEKHGFASTTSRSSFGLWIILCKYAINNAEIKVHAEYDTKAQATNAKMTSGPTLN